MVTQGVDETESGGKSDIQAENSHKASEGEQTVDELPLELVEGLLPDEASRPKFDLDVDESMLMWKVRRMLHEEDYKKIFDNPRVGEV